MTNRPSGLQHSPPTLKPTNGANRFRLQAPASIEQALRIFREQSGLKHGEFATNGWGFPVMPKPFPRRNARHIRLAPKSADRRVIGHPIYWVTPELTEQRPAESDEHWSIRMYFLLTRLGHWSGSGWIDFLDSRGIALTDSDIDAYHQGGIATISTDLDERFRLLNEEDVIGGLALVEHDFEEAIDATRTIISQERSAFGRLLREATASVAEYVGPSERAVLHHRLDAEGADGYWSTHAAPHLSRLADDFDSAVSRQGGQVAALVDRAIALGEHIDAALDRMRRSAVALTLPISLATEGPAGSTSEMLAYLQLSANGAEGSRMSTSATQRLCTALENTRTVGALDIVISEVTETYVSAWNALRLAFVNWRLYCRRVAPLHTHYDLEARLLERAGVIRTIANRKVLLRGGEQPEGESDEEIRSRLLITDSDLEEQARMMETSPLVDE